MWLGFFCRSHPNIRTIVEIITGNHIIYFVIMQSNLNMVQYISIL